jgi:hypothetical protein
LTPLDRDVADAVSKLDDNQAEWFQERAAVIEHDGGIDRRTAERQALAQTRTHFGLA